MNKIELKPSSLKISQPATLGVGDGQGNRLQKYEQMVRLEYVPAHRVRYILLPILNRVNCKPYTRDSERNIQTGRTTLQLKRRWLKFLNSGIPSPQPLVLNFNPSRSLDSYQCYYYSLIVTLRLNLLFYFVEFVLDFVLACIKSNLSQNIIESLFVLFVIWCSIA